MSVQVTFECDGCFEKAPETKRLSSQFVSVSGRAHGFGSRIVQGVTELTPDGWIAFDPYTGCCYCPLCWQEIFNQPAPAPNHSQETV